MKVTNSMIKNMPLHCAHEGLLVGPKDAQGYFFEPFNRLICVIKSNHIPETSTCGCQQAHEVLLHSKNLDYRRIYINHGSTNPEWPRKWGNLVNHFVIFCFNHPRKTISKKKTIKSPPTLVNLKFNIEVLPTGFMETKLIKHVRSQKNLCNDTSK